LVSHGTKGGNVANFGQFDQELLQEQQSAYSVVGVDETQVIEKPGKRKKELAHDHASKRQKTDIPRPITAIYVQQLPLDVTVDEIKEHFSKCGILQEDAQRQPKIKLYQEDGKFTGNALIMYAKPESVELAIQLLDDAELRLGNSDSRLKVTKAEFKPKEVKEQQPKDPKERKKHSKQLDKKLGWFEEDDSKQMEKFNKICILKHCFSPKEIDQDPTLLIDLKEDVRDECEKLGKVTNVTLYDTHPDGVISIRFHDGESAKACVMVCNLKQY
jgi:HIV Tat-specific factor 1